jgi:ATP-binding cassette, subfamily B, bacterial MsbA
MMSLGSSMQGFGSGSRGPTNLDKEALKLKTSPWKLMRRLAAIISGFKRELIISIVGVVGAAGLQITMPWAFKHVIDTTIPSGNARELLVIAVALTVMQGVRYVLNYGQRYYMAVVTQQLVYRMATDLFEHIQRLSLRFFEKWGTGEIISRTTNDIQALQQMVQGTTIMSVAGIFNMAAFAVIMFLLNWQMTLLVFITVPMLVFASTFTAEKLRVRYLRVQQKSADVNNVLQENISGVRVSKAFAQESEQRRRFQRENRGNLDAYLSTATVQAIATPSIQMIAAGGMALVLGFGTWQIVRGGMTVGTLVAFVSYLIQFYQPVEDIIRVNNVLQQSLAAAERIFEFIDETPDVQERPNAVPLKDVRGEVRFENVTFAYEPGKPVLLDVSITAQAGQIVALVGHTGSGKTTMVNLIPRFYDPDAGRLTIEGLDLRDVTLESLRDNIAVVIQETFLFGASIRDNIRYGRLNATDDEVEEASKQAHAHEFISKLAQGYDSWAGEGGILLSRGQRQRIALARAILKDPRILILDEATSDVDTETEALIQQALETVMQGRTTFVIAHRLSTIRHAHQIVVMDHGRVVERGSHQELLASGGYYRDLYDAQFAGQEERQNQIDQLSASGSMTTSSPVPA